MGVMRNISMNKNLTLFLLSVIFNSSYSSKNAILINVLILFPLHLNLIKKIHGIFPEERIRNYHIQLCYLCKLYSIKEL